MAEKLLPDMAANFLERSLCDSPYARSHGGNLWRAVEAYRQVAEKEISWDRRMLAPWHFWMRLAAIFREPDFRTMAKSCKWNPGGSFLGSVEKGRRFGIAAFLLMLASWRPFKDIVSFDPDARALLAKGGIEGVDSGIFPHFPACAAWFDAPGIEVERKEYDGFFAGVVFGENDDDRICGVKSGANLILVFIGREEAQGGLYLRNNVFSLNFDRGSEAASEAEKADGLDWKDAIRAKKSPGIAEAVAMCAYFCSYGLFDEASYRPESVSRKAEAKSTKKGPVIFAAQNPAFREMGKALGDAARAAGKTGVSRKGYWRRQSFGSGENRFQKTIFVPPKAAREGEKC